jgi:hypothetical protein
MIRKNSAEVIINGNFKVEEGEEEVGCGQQEGE